MAELEGATLGQKHQRYNALFQDAIASQTRENGDNFNLENNYSDIKNLLEIDIASHNKDTNFFFKVLSCNDMLYVSRAIKQSNWIINDETYAHFINPKYLSTNIFPHMSSKAKYKLMRHIRNNLNDEKRSEEFYSHEENPKEAAKWLPGCSIKFIEENIKNHIQHIKMTLLRRLCEKSIKVLEIYIKHNNTGDHGKALQTNMFLLPSHTDKYLDIVEAVPSYNFPTFNKRATKILMKNSSRIIDKFEMYYNRIHLPTFIKCLKPENIKDFLICQAQKMQENIYRYFNFERLILYVKLMPKEIRFEFVKQVFIDKIHESKGSYKLSDKEIEGMTTLCKIPSRNPYYSAHIWYQFAPFEVAFQKIKEFIGSASKIPQKLSMLEVLLTSAQQNMIHQRKFLEYFRNMHINAESQIKEQILKKILTQNSFLKYDAEMWALLNDILETMDIYTESENKQFITDAIIVYKVIHDEKVPETLEKKFIFNLLVPYYRKLTEGQKTMVFTYLYSFIMAKISKCDTQSEKEFAEKLSSLEQALKLLKDFKQDLKSYPDLICIIKGLIKLKNDNSWNVNMEALFSIKKTWRKIFFEESLAICPTESNLLNALKHGPYLLEQNKNIVQNMLSNNKLSLDRFLGKIKIYWSNNLAENITLTYTEKLDFAGDHKTTARGLSILLPKRNLRELLEKYAPKEAKIDWSKINEIELSVQQQFAKNMHKARPQPHPEVILWYAKGDYLRYALPSLLSIFYNLDSISSRKYIPTLLDAPVSLQKHGIRLAVSKMEIGELLHQFLNIWKNNSNASIRSVMFKNVFDLLCKEKDSKKIQTTWELMEMFIDNLTFQEDKAIYKLLFEVQKVSVDVRGCYYMKSYKFLHKLLTDEGEHEDFKHNFYSTFTEHSIDLIEQLEPNFVAEIILEFINTVFTKNKVNWSRQGSIKLISSYLLVANNEESQLERYKTVLQPLIKQLYTLSNVLKDEEYFYRDNMTSLLNNLRSDVQKYVVDKKKVIPRTMFSLIQKELEETLTNPESYMLLTKWKLTTLFIDIIYTHQSISNWDATCTEVATEFGNKCNNLLREDCKKYYPSLYLLFGKALESMLQDFVSQIAYWDIYSCFVQHKDFVHGYLVAMNFYQSTYISDDNDEIKRKSKELLKKIREHPSIEIKIHYYNKIQSDKEHEIE